MERIGLYKQLTPFTNENAGTSEWCIAEKDGEKYFVKKFQSPVYPSKDLGLSEKKYQSRVAKFHAAEGSRKAVYRALQENDTSGTLVVPVEVINYQYHICTIAEYIVGNVKSNEVYKLSEWQRVVLMRTLTLALINVHRAGVVHSDMKPDNVLITQNAQNGSCALKLIDFDGSFMAINPPEDATGDPAYFSPEAYAMSMMPGIRLDKRIDVFALGLIFHYFWTGRLPEKNADQTIGQCILKGESVKLDSSIPEQLRTIIKQCLEGNPDKRITGEQLYKELEKILPSYPVRIINLQSDKTKTATAGTKEKTATRGTEATKRTTVPVTHCDKEPMVSNTFRQRIDDDLQVRQKKLEEEKKRQKQAAAEQKKASTKMKWRKGLKIALILCLVSVAIVEGIHLIQDNSYSSYQSTSASRTSALKPILLLDGISYEIGNCTARDFINHGWNSIEEEFYEVILYPHETNSYEYLLEKGDEMIFLGMKNNGDSSCFLTDGTVYSIYCSEVDSASWGDFSLGSPVNEKAILNAGFQKYDDYYLIYRLETAQMTIQLQTIESFNIWVDMRIETYQ